MGVTGLWQILQPCARPIKIETLNRKRLAVDASIWIYQFLKAVRDKEGNALRNSHVVGFFRRICKLLFFGIKPVFVFDGGAPALKRQTITSRKRRREGRRDDAVRTAGKLLAVQMQRRAEEEEQKRKERRTEEEEEAVPDEELVYVDELQMNQQERQQNRKFRKKDAYHLPEMDTSMTEMGGPNDPRIMSLEELESYARQFDTGEDINVYDFSKIDYDSPFFTSLPASDRYNILNAARLRSRLRMGHSKEQLDSMFPDRMAFSRFQIERVQERNELTQRLMNINDPSNDPAFGLNGTGRVAGEKGRQYVLVKNDGAEGGWALGVIGDEGKQDKPIELDRPAPVAMKEESDGDDDDAFEDVPIEGLNRLPKRRKVETEAGGTYAEQRKAFYKSRRQAARGKPKRPAQPDNPNSLFVAEESAEEVWEDVDANRELFGEDGGPQDEEDEELRRAIAMSLEKEAHSPDSDGGQHDSDAEDDDDFQEVFHKQTAAADAKPVPKGSARAIANILNKRAHEVAPDSHEVTSFGVPVPKHDGDGDEEADDSMDLQAALAENRRGKRKITPPARRQQQQQPKPAKTDVAQQAGFSGPLPFEKLDLGSSLLGRKKTQQRSEEVAGGFEKPELGAKRHEHAKQTGPLPPWFSGDLEDDIEKQRALETQDRERAKEFNERFQFQGREGTLKRNVTGEIIDLDADEDDGKGRTKDDAIDLEAEEGKDVRRDDEIRMGDLAEAVIVEPPMTSEGDHRKATPPRSVKGGPFQDDESDEEEAIVPDVEEPRARPRGENKMAGDEAPKPIEEEADEEQGIEWSESEDEATTKTKAVDVSPSTRAENQPTPHEPSEHANTTHSGDLPSVAEPAGGQLVMRDEPSKSPSPDFEDVNMEALPGSPSPMATDGHAADDDDMSGLAPASGLVRQETVPEDGAAGEFDDFSDPEEEELLKALTLEAEEHARFANTLNPASSVAQNMADYENELKQLRNQQKKDRRDADEVTHIMITECQQLLRLFGLPYITAPMEAEAQCAELVRLGLVDGIVTDDSDCFLFGGTRVYKNMFNQAKFVECYLAADLEKEFDLKREKLIQVAHLLGSDYTEGLPGVGPVTALEILGEFASLADFKEWWSGVQMNVVPKEADQGHPFRKKFRKNATKIFLPPAFPDARVDVAYENPEVDSDPQPFQWGVPDLEALRGFLMATIGWSQERTDEVLVPVIRDMNRRMDEGTQSNITAFFDGGVGVGAAAAKGGSREAFAPRKRAQGSKRMGDALTRMAERAKGRREGSEQDGDGQGDEVGGVEDGDEMGAARSENKRAKSRDEMEENSAEMPKAGSGDEHSDFDEPRKKNSRKKKPAVRAAKGKRKRAATATAVDD